MAAPLPRYFVARSGAPDNSGVQAPIMQIIDSFLVGGRHLSEMDCVVGVDAAGDLQICGMASARQFDEVMQGQLTYNELSARAGRRILSVGSRLYLFALQLLEQPGDSPGLNDPVYLYGKLFGIFPEAPNSLGIEGQLTVTRADILQGIADGDKYGFTYAAGTNHSQLPTRCLHFMVPGDNDSELQRGAGAVIVYPLPTAELAANDPSNEMTIKQIVFDILQSLKKDLEANNVRSKLSKLDLPVPSRSALEASLEARGYGIKGNTAVRKMPVPGVNNPIMDGVLEHLYGKITRDKLELPPEGTLDDFVELAGMAMKSISGWPPERCRLLARLSRSATAEEIARASQSIDPAPRAARTPQRPSSNVRSNEFNQAASPPRQVAANPGPAAWMKDFMSNHQAGAAATITPSGIRGSNLAPQKQAGPKSKPAEPSKAEWMDDFAPAKEEIKHNKTKQEENESKPDWMGDFQ